MCFNRFWLVGPGIVKGKRSSNPASQGHKGLLHVRPGVVRTFSFSKENWKTRGMIYFVKYHVEWLFCEMRFSTCYHLQGLSNKWNVHLNVMWSWEPTSLSLSLTHTEHENFVLVETFFGHVQQWKALQVFTVFHRLHQIYYPYRCQKPNLTTLDAPIIQI